MKQKSNIQLIIIVSLLIIIAVLGTLLYFSTIGVLKFGSNEAESIASRAVAGPKMAFLLQTGQSVANITETGLTVKRPGQSDVVISVDYSASSTSLDINLKSFLAAYGDTISTSSTTTIPINDYDTVFTEITFNDGGQSAIAAVQYADRFIVLQTFDSLDASVKDLAYLVDTIRLERL